MAQFIDITNRFLNNSKRETGLLVVTCPAIIQEGSHRTNVGPTYIQYGDAWTAQVIATDSITTRIFLQVVKPFPDGTKVSVDIAGVPIYTDVKVDYPRTAQSVAGNHQWLTAQTATISISGGTGDVTRGELRLIMEVLYPGIRGQAFV